MSAGAAKKKKKIKIKMTKKGISDKNRLERSKKDF
jgi:hypothetical protein